MCGLQGRNAGSYIISGLVCNGSIACKLVPFAEMFCRGGTEASRLAQPLPKASFVKRTGTLFSPFQSAAASLQLLCRRRGPWLNLAIQKDLTRWPRKGKTLKIEAAAADAALKHIAFRQDFGKQAVRAATRLQRIETVQEAVSPCMLSPRPFCTRRRVAAHSAIA